MNNQSRLKGAFLVLIALAFGLAALRYPMGTPGHAGPGLMPLLVSSLLLLLGIAILVRSFFGERIALSLHGKSIAIILLSLCGFALLSKHVDMIAGIVFLVFCASAASSSYSNVRCLVLAACLVGVAFAFQKFLGLQLPLY